MYLFRFLFTLFVFASFISLTSAFPRQNGRHRSEPEHSQLELEQQARLEIKIEDERQRKIEETYQELEEIVNKLNIRWQTNLSLQEEDIKQLKRIEKLARTLCATQGINEDSDKQIKNLPSDFSEQKKLLTQYISELKVQVLKRTRYTTSITIAEKAKQIISLTKLLSSSFKKN